MFAVYSSITNSHYLIKWQDFINKYEKTLKNDNVDLLFFKNNANKFVVVKKECYNNLDWCNSSKVIADNVWKNAINDFDKINEK